MAPSPQPTPLAEQRRSPRIHIQVPMFARGVDASGAEFYDLTKTLDIGCHGALLLSPRALQPTQILHLTIPVPPSPAARFPAETPPILARIRRQHESNGAYLIGVEFLRALE